MRRRRMLGLSASRSVQMLEPLQILIDLDTRSERQFHLVVAAHGGIYGRVYAAKEVK